MSLPSDRCTTLARTTGALYNRRVCKFILKVLATNKDLIMGVSEFYKFLGSEHPQCRQSLNAGEALELYLRGKIVSIDVAQWLTKTSEVVSHASAFQKSHISDEQRSLYPLQELFFRIRNLVLRGGARYIIGVLDASKASRG